MIKNVGAQEKEPEELSLLVHHYETSFAIIQGRERVRDRLTWWVLSLSLSLTLVVFSDIFSFTEPPRGGWPWVAYALRGDRLQFILWVLLLVASLRHAQLASRIEGEYRYLHALEEHIDNKFSWTFCRERAGYDETLPFPQSRKTFSFLYKAFVPLIVVAQTSAVIIFHWLGAPLTVFPSSFSETTLLVATVVWGVTTFTLLNPLQTLWGPSDSTAPPQKAN